MAEGEEKKVVHFGLQLKSACILLLVVFGVTVAGGWFYFDAARRSLRQGDLRHALGLAEALGIAAGYDLRRGADVDLERIAADFLRKKDVRYVAILDRAGLVVASASAEADRHRWKYLERLPVTISVVERGEGELVVARPIVARDAVWWEDRLAGAVRVVFDTRETTARLLAVRRDILAVGAGIMLIGLPLAYLLVSRMLVRPIRRLAALTGRLGRGEFHARAEIRRSDEIGQLAAAFDSMADDLAQMRDELLGANERLEQTVAERTAQLRRTNTRLRGKMAENLRLQGRLEDALDQVRRKNAQLEASLDRVRLLAATDHLTGLANRRWFGEELERRFSEAVRYGHDLTCCMCDLDHYKQLNDALGHQVGDEILVLVADVIRTILRRSDLAGRYGGDEFVLLMPNTGSDEAAEACQRLREQLALRLADYPPAARAVSISMGIASLRADQPASADELVSLADRALYAAKRAGRDRIVLHGTPPAPTAY